MKRFVEVFLSFVLVLMLLTPVTCFAVELAEEGGDAGYHTIFTRLWEFVTENKTEVISAAGSGLVIIVSAIIKGINSKSAKKQEETLNLIQTVTNGTATAQGSIIDVVNRMIGGFNIANQKVETMYQAYQKNQMLENERNRLLGAMMVEVTAILEMMSSVYVHNSHLPQGIKDLVVLKYANVQKALSDDELLYAIVESVREKINFESAVTSEEVTEEETVI